MIFEKKGTSETKNGGSPKFRNPPHYYHYYCDYDHYYYYYYHDYYYHDQYHYYYDDYYHDHYHYYYYYHLLRVQLGINIGPCSDHLGSYIRRKSFKTSSQEDIQKNMIFGKHMAHQKTCGTW